MEEGNLHPTGIPGDGQSSHDEASVDGQSTQKALQGWLTKEGHQLIGVLQEVEQLGPDDTANGRVQCDVARALPRMHGDSLLLRGLEPLLDILLPTEPAHDHAHQDAEDGIPGPAEQVLLGWATALEQVRGIDQKPKHLPAEYESKQTADTHAKGPRACPTQTVFSVVGSTPSFSLR